MRAASAERVGKRVQLLVRTSAGEARLMFMPALAAEIGRDAPGNRRPHAAEGHQREIAWIMAALDRDDAQRADHVVVVGANGAGKSTMIKVLAGGGGCG